MQKRWPGFTAARRMLSGGAGPAALALSISACQSVQLPQRDLISADGAFATVLSGRGHGLQVGTLSVLPGSESTAKVARSLECANGPVETHIGWVGQDPVSDQLAWICTDATHAVRLALQTVRLNDTPVRYQVTIVSDGGGIWQQPARPVRPELVVAFWFPAGDDAAALRARVISTTAHEFHHIATAMAGQRRWGAHREPEAYLAGACALLAIEGELRREQLPGRHDPRADSLLPAAAQRSGNAGNAMGQSLQAFFSGDRIQRDDEEGRALLRHCHHTIGFPAIAH